MHVGHHIVKSKIMTNMGMLFLFDSQTWSCVSQHTHEGGCLKGLWCLLWSKTTQYMRRCFASARYAMYIEGGLSLRFFPSSQARVSDRGVWRGPGVGGARHQWLGLSDGSETPSETCMYVYRNTHINRSISM